MCTTASWSTRSTEECYNWSDSQLCAAVDSNYSTVFYSCTCSCCQHALHSCSYKSEAYFEKLEVLPIVHVHATPNNTICTITDNKGTT